MITDTDAALGAEYRRADWPCTLASSTVPIQAAPRKKSFRGGFQELVIDSIQNVITTIKQPIIDSAAQRRRMTPRSNSGHAIYNSSASK